MSVNFENPKIISKCFNCVHMLLRNYSVNIWENGCQFYCAKNRCGNSARDPSRYISGPKSKVPGLVMSSFLQSAFYPGPRGHSNTKNTASPTPVETTDWGFYHNIAEEHGYVCSLTQKCVVSIKIPNKWSRGQGWQTLVMVLRQTVGLLWWNLEVRKHMKKTPWWCI